MKKLVLAIGLVAFLMGGVFATNAVSLSLTPNSKVVTDDPPKAKKKSCAEMGSKSSCCDSKSKGKSECKDKEGATSTKATTTETTTETKKSSPDKK